MNILLVSEVYMPTVSGVATSTDSIARFLLERGHSVTLLCPRYRIHDPAIIPKGLRVVFAPSVPDPFFVGKTMTIFPFGFFVVFPLFRKTRFDIVHIQEPGSLGITALLCAKVFRVPTLGAMHFSLEQIALLMPKAFYAFTKFFTAFYIRLVYPLYDGVMVPTETFVVAARMLLDMKKDIRAISNGVDITLFVPAREREMIALRKKWGIPEKKVIFTYIGRLDIDKNLETTIRALVHADPAAHVVIAGIGRYVEVLHAYAQKIGVFSRITWIRKLNIKEMIEVYQASDCFVITSPVETQSIVTLQAIACGLPVLAANEGALPELVHDGVNGYLIKFNDEIELAARMNELQEEGLRKSMAVESRKISLTHHKPTALLKLETFYNDIIQKKQQKV